MLLDYYNPKTVENKDYTFATNSLYAAPDLKERDEYQNYINKLPLITTPDVFGFHANADITKDLNETNLLTNVKNIFKLFLK